MEQPARTQAIAIRAAVIGDVTAIQALYDHHAKTGTGTFDLEAPSVAVMEARFRAVANAGWPWLAAVLDQQLVGYAYAAPFRDRPAYAGTLEDSVYVAPDAVGKGVGQQLLSALLSAATMAGGRQMLAVIGDSQNQASIHLHAKLGFRQVGVFERVGQKFGRVLDVVLMQKTLLD